MTVNRCEYFPNAIELKSECGRLVLDKAVNQAPTDCQSPTALTTLCQSLLCVILISVSITNTKDYTLHT